MRHAAVALAVLVLLGGIYVGLRAGDTACASPVLFAPDFADTPGDIVGTASMQGDIVRVELRRGEEVLAEDENMDGAENLFEFHIENEELHGQDLTVVAIAQDGSTTTHVVHIN